MAACHLFRSVSRGLNIVKSPFVFGQRNVGPSKAPTILLDIHNLKGHIEASNTYYDIIVSDRHGTVDEEYDTITIGGDHMVAYDSISYQLTKTPSKKFGLIWIDAHTDINTQHTSLTNNKHGMVVSNLMGLDDCIVGPFDDFKKKGNVLDPQNIVYIGARDIDPGEQHIINEHDINVLGSPGSPGSMANHVTHALQWLLKDCDHIHVSFDVDVMDPATFPATGTPVANGIGFRTVTEMTKILYHDTRVRSMDLVEYDPEKDDRNYTCGLLATDIITSTFTNNYAFGNHDISCF